MKIHDGYTPREYAYAKTIDCIRALHGETYGANAMMEGLTPSQTKAVQEQLAKLHNKLLEAANLDGIAL